MASNSSSMRRLGWGTVIEETHRRAFELAAVRETPAFFFSRERLDHAISTFNSFMAELPFSVETYYSYKTNYLPALCEHVEAAGFGAEVTSLLEWELATAITPPSRIVVNGIGKQAGLLEAVLNSAPPRLINIETDTEVDHIAKRKPDAAPVSVGLRVTVPGLSGESGRDPSVHWRRGPSKFGWMANGTAIIQTATKLAAFPAVRLQALHLHLGGQLVSPAVYERALAAGCRLLERLRQNGVSITTLDMGGGLASGWVTKHRVGPLFELLRTVGVPTPGRPQRAPDLQGVSAVFIRFADRLRSLGIKQLVVEPGRFVAEPSMLAVASVIAVRHDGRRRHAVIDLGTNALHCWRQDETRPISFETGRAPRSGGQHRYELVGPLCHRSDTLGTVTTSAPLRPGMKVCLDAVGAYSLGDWVANAWHRPPVFDLEDGSILWDRQTTPQFWAPATSPAEPLP
ncbi:diaminopimelate decarboxylase family protein [Actinomadura sp. 6N118]|uniref:diaminopimelate decarboxylase family protein n=1 Tax=Actinomadura sp. 6N118 TaxID=3375151 RepID=UPI0037A571AB